MAKGRKRKYRVPDPPPGDAGNYVLIESKEGPYWRRKRGTVTKATINSSLKKYAAATALASPAAKRIKDKLHEFLNVLDTARFIANVSTRLKKVYLKTGAWNYSLMMHYEFQPDFYTGEILRTQHFVVGTRGELSARITINRHTVRPLSKLITNYYFELILLWGDPSRKNSLRVDSETSPVYSIAHAPATEWRISMDLPQKGPWMAILKLSCLEKNKPALHPRHYGMKVVAVG